MKIILVQLVLLVYHISIFAQSAPSIPVSRHRFIVIAHRGDHTLVPENTLEAFKKGITNGVDYVEVDLRTTKDSVLVIMHDATVDRMTNGTGKISSLNYSHIRRLKILDKTKTASKTYDIPTFEEVLKTCKNKIYIYLDFKDASVRQAHAMIKKYGMEHEVIVYINSPGQYREWKAVAPAMPLMLSLPDSIRAERDLVGFLAKTPVVLLDGDYIGYTAALVKTAEASGVKVWPDIQSPAEAGNWDDALDIGFTGLQTDHPGALIAFLKKKGLR